MKTTSDAERVARWRRRHPDRAEQENQRIHARAVAARQLAQRHPEEYERLLRAECRRRGVPRWSPPLDPKLDGRINRHRKAS